MLLVVVTSCHLGLLMLLLRPVASGQGATPIVESLFPALELRFIHAPHASPPRPRAPTRQPVEPVVHHHATLAARPSNPPVARRSTDVDRQPRGTRSTHEVLVTRAPDTVTEEDSGSDGGFLERLRKAQRPRPPRGVPGSDTAHAPGIHLVDPMKQGMGAVVRTVQRAFGIKDRHCIDVEVWRRLTPEELSERHISPSGVDRVDEKYRCNDPPGLHF